MKCFQKTKLSKFTFEVLSIVISEILVNIRYIYNCKLINKILFIIVIYFSYKNLFSFSTNLELELNISRLEMCWQV